MQIDRSSQLFVLILLGNEGGIVFSAGGQGEDDEGTHTQTKAQKKNKAKKLSKPKPDNVSWLRILAKFHSYAHSHPSTHSLAHSLNH